MKIGALAILVCAIAVSACTAILGDFEVVDDAEWFARKHCRSDEDCRDNFHPEAFCRVDAGNTCRVVLPADAGPE